MITCPNCGAVNADGAGFCVSCGAPLSTAPAAATKKEFLKLPENKKVRSELNGASIICYVCAGITLAVGIAAGGFPFVLLDVAILVGLGLGIHLSHSRVCAVILLVYAAVNSVVGLLQSGRFSGYLVLIAGIFAVIYTFRAEKSWQAYRQQHGL